MVSDAGLLQIDWPVQSENGAPLEFDLLFATSNDPAPQLPSVEQIAEAWVRHPARFEYFRSNRQHGITTFQDDEIQAQLNRLIPERNRS